MRITKKVNKNIKPSKKEFNAETKTSILITDSIVVIQAAVWDDTVKNTIGNGELLILVSDLSSSYFFSIIPARSIRNIRSAAER